MSRAVIWGPIGMGGTALNTNILSLQAQCAAKYLVMIIRWDDIVSKDVIAATNALLQLASGLGTQVLENTAMSIKYVGEGWLINLRDMLRNINAAGVWIEKAWRPQKQRQHDQAIMDAFNADSDITPLTMILANEFRMWMRVTYVSELANLEGTAIPFERISNGSVWRAIPTNDLKLPNTVHPASAYGWHCALGPVRSPGPTMSFITHWESGTLTDVTLNTAHTDRNLLCTTGMNSSYTHAYPQRQKAITGLTLMPL
jgi:hypothetical protein